MKKKKRTEARPAEIAVVGDVDEWEADVIKQLLEVPPGGECVFYIDSAGGSIYGALAVVTMLRHRKIQAAAVVLGECSSAALLLFAACPRRLVTAYSALMFHRLRWQSDKRIGAAEAHTWAAHFTELEQKIDSFQARLFGRAEEKVRNWTSGSVYVSGPQMVEAGLAEMLEI